MPQRFRNIGNVCAGAFQYRSEGVARRVGRDITDSEICADCRHSFVDRPRQILCFQFPPHRILRPVQYRKDEPIRSRRISPAVDNSLHPVGHYYPYLLAGSCRPCRLLPHETDFPVYDVPIPQPHEIRDVDPVAQVQEQPIIAVFGRCIASVIISGYLSYLHQRKGHFAPFAFLYFKTPLPERVLCLLDDSLPACFVEDCPQVPQVDCDRRLLFAFTL